MRYAIVIERAGSNYSAYVPDLPGCVATGATPAETEKEIREALSGNLCRCTGYQNIVEAVILASKEINNSNI